MKISCLSFLVLLASFSAAFGQANSRMNTPVAPKKKELQDAVERLKKARETIDVNKAKEAAQGVLQKLPEGVTGQVTNAAKEAMKNQQTKDNALDAVRAAATTMAPDAQKVLGGVVDQETKTAKVEEPPATGPKPGALMPLVEADPRAGTRSITIDSDHAVFDLNGAVFIYTGHVRARHPQFYIECEELEVHMNKEEEASKSKKAAAKNDDIMSPDQKKAQQSGIKFAIARGPMVTIKKLTENGEMQQGKCKKAVYESSTGQITMSDFPQVQRGNVLQLATSAETTMVFNQAGKLTTNGPSKTDILQGAGKGDADSGLPPTGSKIQ